MSIKSKHLDQPWSSSTNVNLLGWRRWMATNAEILSLLHVQQRRQTWLYAPSPKHKGEVQNMQQLVWPGAWGWLGHSSGRFWPKPSPPNTFAGGVLRFFCFHQATPLACHIAWNSTLYPSKSFILPGKQIQIPFKGEHVSTCEIFLSY